jgi:uncharacterized alpha/beta hydrolase family protein
LTNAKAANTVAESGYVLDKDLSNRQHKVFTDKNGNPTVAYTGSRTAYDWLVTDPLLAVGLGKYTSRFKQSKRVMDKVKSKYQMRPITATGHSLGGYLADAVGANKVVTVDKAVGLDGIGKKIKKNQTDIRTTSDLVSGLSLTQHGGKHITIPNTVHLNPIYSHDIKHVKKIRHNI